MRRTFLVLSFAASALLAAHGDAFAYRRGADERRGSANGGRARVGRGFFRGGYYGGAAGYDYPPSYYAPAPGYESYPATPIATPQVRHAYYPAPAQDFAHVMVLVPTAEAQVWFQGQATTQTGMQRLYNSPALAPNENYTYTIKALWMEDGKPVIQERKVHVHRGQNVTVNFREKFQEIVASPVQPAPAAPFEAPITE